MSGLVVPQASWRTLAASFGLLLTVFGIIALDGGLIIREILASSSFGAEDRLVTPVTNPDGEHTRNFILPSAPDGRWWIMYVERMARTSEWRIRHTDNDNPPGGREVHWSSLPMWTLWGVSKILSPTNPRTDFSPVEWAALFVGPLLMMIFASATLLVVVQAFGRTEAMALAVGLIGAHALLYFLRAGETDHHGYAAFFAMGGVLLLLASRLGLDAHAWVVAAAISTAAGMWISTATVLPVLVGTGLGVGLASLVLARSHPDAIRPETWRLWGVVGGAASLAFYLLEYFPNHLGMRLEVNNFLYSFAFTAAGEMLCRVTGFLKTGRPPWATPWGGFVVGACLIVCAAPLALIVFGGERFFLINDRFLYSLHDYYINEFMSMSRVTGQAGLAYLFLSQILAAISSILVALALTRRGISARDVALILFAILPALVMALLSFKQVRWGGTAAALWLPVIVVAFHLLVGAWRAGIRWRLVAGWVGIAAAAAPFTWNVTSRTYEAIHAGDTIPQTVVPSIVSRDIAQRLAATDPARRPVILAGPSSTTDFIYYGGAKGIGSLYWENLAGLQKAAEVYATTDEIDALGRIRDLGITHIVLFSWDSFGQRYVRLERGLGAEEEARDGFIPALLEGTRRQPTWLNPLFYPIPPQLKLDKNQWVRIYEVAIGQSEADWFYHVALYQLDAGKPDLAIRSFREAIQRAPANPSFRVGLLTLLAAEGNQDEVTSEADAWRAQGGADVDGFVRALANDLEKAGQAAPATLLRGAARR